MKVYGQKNWGWCELSQAVVPKYESQKCACDKHLEIARSRHREYVKKKKQKSELMKLVMGVR